MAVVIIERPKPLSKKDWPANYSNVTTWRYYNNAAMATNKLFREGAIELYASNPVQFILDCCDTFDPRNAYDEKLSTTMPFILFERQAEMVNFLQACLATNTNGLIDKSRDMGATWICVAFSVWLWLFKEGAAIGWGSRKEELVDRLGDPKSIFEKIRSLIRGLPPALLPKGFDFSSHATYMKLINPENGATISGEAGDNIGRGGRTLVYFKDESAWYEHAEMVEAALMDNTNVQIDISTTSGVGTVYDRKKEVGVDWTPGAAPPSGAGWLFTMDWRDHPAKTQEWYDKREKEARNSGLLHLFRQEVDRDPTATLQGIIIKPEWVKAAVDAHIDLNFGDDGGWAAGFDPYDEGGDQHAFSLRKGVVLYEVDDWGEGDTGEATREVISRLTGKTPVAVQYDCVGIGAGVKSEANRLAKTRGDGGEPLLPRGISFHPWDGGDAVVNPEARVVKGDPNSPMNKDFYANFKAQGWWELARRFERVYRARKEGIKFPPGELISLSSKMPKLRQLQRELSQPVMVKTGDLRLKVDKKPEGARSPNLGDSVMMNYFPARVPMIVSAASREKAAQWAGRR